MSATTHAPRPHRKIRWWELAVVLAGLGAFAALLLASVRETSLTFDEVAHAAGGAALVQRHDFRLQPENGALPQWVAGMMLRNFPLPPRDGGDAWREGDAWGVGYSWLYESGHDGVAMAWRARAGCALFAIALGGVVWIWARRLFGAAGGMISLLLYTLSPTVLANGALITSDLAAALFFTTSVWAVWSLAHRISATRVLLCGLSIGALFLSKMSALLILPMAGALLAVRFFFSGSLGVGAGERVRAEANRAREAGRLALAAAWVALIAFAVVWAGYGFRFSAFGGNEQERHFPLPWEYVLAKPAPAEVMRPAELRAEQIAAVELLFSRRGVDGTYWSNAAVAAWNEARHAVLDAAQRARTDARLAEPSPTMMLRSLDFVRQREWLPEAWIYGMAHVLRQTEGRMAFLNGEVRAGGWWWFFPYNFAVKTPLVCLGVLLTAGVAAVAGRRWREICAAGYDCAPLWILLGVYGAVALGSTMNIGHRHLLPVYPAVFVLAGAAARWLDTRWGPAAFAMVAGGLAIETLGRFPHYLAYFNGVVPPAKAYRHLVDSSLDWGQDLPAVRGYLAKHPASQPVFFSYFGAASPEFHGVHARALHSFFGVHRRQSPDFSLVRLPAELAAAQLEQFQRSEPEFEVMAAERQGGDVVAAILRRPWALRLTGGTYLISATMLQAVHFEGSVAPHGKWNARHEETYRQLAAAVQPLLSDDAAVRREGFERQSVTAWGPLLRRFDAYRFARLAAFLRGREPDDMIAYTVLVYRLSEADVARALEGPAPVN